MFSPIKQARLYQHIADRVKQQILSGELEYDAQLPSEQMLAEQFEVSRTAVREAIKALEREGLVEVRHGRGTYVTDGTSAAFKESFTLMMMLGGGDTSANLVEVRAMLEPAIATLAARRLTDVDINAMEEAVATMDESLNDVKAFVDADSVFHMALAQATGNELIVKLIEPIVDLLHEMRAEIFKVPGGPERGQYHHKRILAALKAHNPEAARQAMIAHMQQVGQDSGVKASFDLHHEHSLKQMPSSQEKA